MSGRQKMIIKVLGPDANPVQFDETTAIVLVTGQGKRVFGGVRRIYRTKTGVFVMVDYGHEGDYRAEIVTREFAHAALLYAPDSYLSPEGKAILEEMGSAEEI
jgi:hypothetical protein